ncbi:MAG: hypothetical protein EOP48_01205 [Sphingobacteriales bacterium]|nr:MAG: hypothetical protein EOP48_01205 [Sphingobacteriales bacterium]
MEAATDPTKISRTIWVKALRPLMKDDILEVFSKLPKQDNNTEWNVVVNSLVDKGYFSAPPHLEYLHASKPIDLLNHWFMMNKRANDGLTDSFSDYGKMAFNAVCQQILQTDIVRKY